ncbi:CfaE/CblD family pilus tip adhesin [Caldalkalibacillus salinus]|uniref:CfaE/CblD family pilus tip adhesin n=1 Tax=Caldalkalibacillus salinus TaxID=2803787 RepID=UPI001923E156|nr:CfaE/CblD family pilus tip adhesin [Caldalkalibacillus salinus]
MAISCLLTFTIIGCTSSTEQAGTDHVAQDELNQLQKEMEELQQEMTVQDQDIQSYEEKLNAYQNFINHDLVNTLDSQQLQSLAESQWKYQLYVNGEEINESNEFQMSTSDLEIKLVETQNIHTVLPTDIHNEGQVSGHMREHIKISPTDYQRVAPAGTNVDSIIYKFENVTSDTIQVTVTDELKERLGFDQNAISINKQ